MVTAPNSRIKGVIKTSFKAHGVVVKDTVRHVGIDYAAGKLRQARPVRGARLRGVMVKAQQFRRLGFTGRVANRLCRTSLVPVAVYGTDTFGPEGQ